MSEQQPLPDDWQEQDLTGMYAEYYRHCRAARRGAWNYYNDVDPYICEWARNLIKAGLVPDGEVDCRSIVDVSADDLRGFRQCHFFCGILGWPLALRLAGWPDDRPVWTGSAPCQPWSSAGKRRGEDDDRHLWPAWVRLIRECRPATIFGEQVASNLGRKWLEGVRGDLDSIGYEFGAADLPASAAGAPHIRSRLFWVANLHQMRRGKTTDRISLEIAGAKQTAAVV